MPEFAIRLLRCWGVRPHLSPFAVDGCMVQQTLRRPAWILAADCIQGGRCSRFLAEARTAETCPFLIIVAWVDGGVHRTLQDSPR